MLPIHARRAAGLFAAVVLPVVLVTSLAGAQGRPRGGGRAENLKVIKPEQVMPTMQMFTRGLGVRCDFCHVQGAFGRDDKPMKVKARQMLVMVNDINKRHRVVEGKVNCFMCHQGKPEPGKGGGGGGRFGGMFGGRERGDDD